MTTSSTDAAEKLKKLQAEQLLVIAVNNVATYGLFVVKTPSIDKANVNAYRLTKDVNQLFKLPFPAFIPVLEAVPPAEAKKYWRSLAFILKEAVIYAANYLSIEQQEDYAHPLKYNTAAFHYVSKMTQALNEGASIADWKITVDHKMWNDCETISESAQQKCLEVCNKVWEQYNAENPGI